MVPFTTPSVTHEEWPSPLSLELVVIATGELSISEKVFSLTTVEMPTDPSPVTVTTVVTGTSDAPSAGMVVTAPVGGGAALTVRLTGRVVFPVPVVVLVKVTVSV
jgi:hypothetical protein